MSAQAYTLLFSAALLAWLLTQFWLGTRQMRHVAAHRDAVPPPFAGTVTPQAHRKAAEYTLAKGRFGLLDYEKAFAPDLKSGQDIFELRGIDRAQGAIVVVRPDQYVANVLPLDAHDALAAFFAAFLIDRH